jgi:hypothetical protein
MPEPVPLPDPLPEPEPEPEVPEPTPPEEEPVPVAIPETVEFETVEERLDEERARAVLEDVLETLGSAHHRPFSRG